MYALDIASVVIGFIAMLLASLTVIPQMIKTLKTKLTVNLSIKTLLIFNFANTLWLIFAIIHVADPALFHSKPNLTFDILWSLILIIPYSITWIATNVVIKIKLSNMIKYHEAGGDLKNVDEAKAKTILNIPSQADSGHAELPKKARL